jgi:hypothetical protein
MSNIKCPKCSFQFNAEENLKESINSASSFFQNIARKRSEPLLKKNDLDETSEAVLTICPNCKNEFPFSEYKFFGFLNSRGMKLLLILIILGFILFAVASLIKDLL